MHPPFACGIYRLLADVSTIEPERVTCTFVPFNQKYRYTANLKMRRIDIESKDLKQERLTSDAEIPKYIYYK